MGSKMWCEIHSYVSMFFLPLAVIYAVTGGLSIVQEREGRGGYGAQIRAGNMIPGGPSHIGHGNSENPGRYDAGLREGRGGRPGGEPSGLLSKLTLLHKAKG